MTITTCSLLSERSNFLGHDAQYYIFETMYLNTKYHEYA